MQSIIFIGKFLRNSSFGTVSTHGIRNGRHFVFLNWLNFHTLYIYNICCTESKLERAAFETIIACNFYLDLRDPTNVFHRVMMLTHLIYIDMIVKVDRSKKKPACSYQKNLLNLNWIYMSNFTKNLPLGTPEMKKNFIEGLPVQPIWLYVFKVIEHEFRHA